MQCALAIAHPANQRDEPCAAGRLRVRANPLQCLRFPMRCAAHPCSAHSRPRSSALNILALETSSAWCSVALWRDGTLRELEEHAGQTHSERLLPMVDALLTQAGM